ARNAAGRGAARGARRHRQRADAGHRARRRRGLTGSVAQKRERGRTSAPFRIRAPQKKNPSVAGRQPRGSTGEDTGVALPPQGPTRTTLATDLEMPGTAAPDIFLSYTKARRAE